MTARKDSKPWYREPWPWILMAGPAIVVVAGIITAWLAFDSNDGLVEDDYYKQGLAINQRLMRDKVAADLGLGAELIAGSNGRDLRLLLTGSQASSQPERILLRLVHPTRAGADQTIELSPDGSGFYVGRLATPVSGRWNVQVEDFRRQWRLAAEWNVVKQPALRLGAAAGKQGAEGLR